MEVESVKGAADPGLSQRVPLPANTKANFLPEVGVAGWGCSGSPHMLSNILAPRFPAVKGAVRMHQHQPQDCQYQTHQHNIGRYPAFLPWVASRALVHISSLPVVAGEPLSSLCLPSPGPHCPS